MGAVLPTSGLRLCTLMIRGVHLLPIARINVQSADDMVLAGEIPNQETFPIERLHIEFNFSDIVDDSILILEYCN